uniref:Uncharacterized protein n=1 Tax=Anguilla anguilla TaxID=7936 RepID=A0A0E9X895_ANGAN
MFFIMLVPTSLSWQLFEFSELSYIAGCPWCLFSVLYMQVVYKTYILQSWALKQKENTHGTVVLAMLGHL